MHRHFLLHKPFGYISQFIGNKKNKKLLGELYDFPEGTMAIGRLDQDSEGLLLLTTDGSASKYIRSENIEKEYYAQVHGEITAEAIEQIQRGVETVTRGLKYQTKPCVAFKLEKAPDFGERGKKIRGEHHGPTSWISITVIEGKFRQIRKVTAVVGFPTLRLVRVRVGSMLLGDLKAGDVKEVDRLY